MRDARLQFLLVFFNESHTFQLKFFNNNDDFFLDIHHISEPIVEEQYVVISDYVKREESGISLKAGNVVDVVEKNEHGRWRKLLSLLNYSFYTLD